MSKQKPFIVKWGGMFVKHYDNLHDAIELCNKLILEGTCHVARVVTERYEPTGDGVSSKKFETTHYSAVLPVQPVEIRV